MIVDYEGEDDCGGILILGLLAQPLAGIQEASQRHGRVHGAPVRRQAIGIVGVSR